MDNKIHLKKYLLWRKRDSLYEYWGLKQVDEKSYICGVHVELWLPEKWDSSEDTFGLQLEKTGNSELHDESRIELPKSTKFSSLPNNPEQRKCSDICKIQSYNWWRQFMLIFLFYVHSWSIVNLVYWYRVKMEYIIYLI